MLDFLTELDVFSVSLLLSRALSKTLLSNGRRATFQTRVRHGLNSPSREWRAVTSSSFRQAVSAGLVARLMLVNAAIAAAGCVIAGLPVFGRGALCVILFATASMVAELIPYFYEDEKSGPPQTPMSAEADAAQP